MKLVKMDNEKVYVVGAIGAMCLVAKAGGERSQAALDETYQNIGRDYVLHRNQGLCLDMMLDISERLDQDFFHESTSILTRLISFDLPYEAADRVFRHALAIVFAEDDPRIAQIDAIGDLASALNLKIYEYLTGSNLVIH